MEGIALTGAWVDRGTRPPVDDRPRTGRVEPALRVPEAGRGGDRDGADRRADGDPSTARPSCSRAAAWATRSCSRLPGPSRQRQPRHLLRRLQEGRGPVQAGGDRSGHRPGDLEHRHRGAGSSRPPAGRAFPRQHRATPWSPTPRESSARQLVPLQSVDRIIAIGSDRMMAAVKSARTAALAPLPEARARRRSPASTRRCSA